MDETNCSFPLSLKANSLFLMVDLKPGITRKKGFSNKEFFVITSEQLMKTLDWSLYSFLQGNHTLNLLEHFLQPNHLHLTLEMAAL